MIETNAEIEDTNKELTGQTNQEQHNEITATKEQPIPSKTPTKINKTTTSVQTKQQP